MRLKVSVLLGVVVLSLFGPDLRPARADDVFVATNWPKGNIAPASAPKSNKMMAVTSDGAVYITGESTVLGQTVLTTWRYESDGSMSSGWPQTWAPTPYEKATGVAVGVDASGGVFVAGTFETPMQGKDIAVLYYSPTGAGALVATYNGPGNGDDYAVGVAVDEQYAIAWVGGVSQGFGTGADYVTMGVDSNGPKLNGTITYDRSTKSDALVDIKAFSAVVSGTADPYSAAVVTGTSYDLTTGEDIQTIEYRYNLTTSAFAAFYAPRYDTSASDKATSLDIMPPPAHTDNHAWIYVSGYNTNNAQALPQILVLGYPADGVTPDWVGIYPGVQDVRAFPAKLVIGLPRDDLFGEHLVYVAGTRWSVTSDLDVVVRAYSLAGAEQWTYISDEEVADDEEAFDIATNTYGDVYVTGSRITTASIRYRTIKVNTSVQEPPLPPDTRFKWAIEYDTPGIDRPAAVRIDPSSGGEAYLSSIYVTGHSGNPTGTTGYVTFRYFQTP